MSDLQTNLLHRPSRSGPKADRKKLRDKKKRGVHEKGQNPRAFTVKSRVKAARAVQRNLDREHKKEVISQVDKTPEYNRGCYIHVNNLHRYSTYIHRNIIYNNAIW